MKNKILSLLGFPAPTPIRTTYVPWKDGAITDHNQLIVDGRQVKDPESLKVFFTRLQSGVKTVKANGHILIFGLKPTALKHVSHSTFQQSLEGIVRSLAKELGRKAITVNLLRIPENKEPTAYAVPEQFFTTGRSAFITAQALNLDGSKPAAGSLEDKVCVVTGGAGGIGSATVKRLASEGCTVVIADVPQMEKQAAPLLNDKVTFLGADLTTEGAREQLLNTIKEKYGRIDVLINNAGITRDKTLKNMPEDYWDKVISINLTAVIALTEKALGMGLIPTGGRIIGTSSISGIAGNFGQTNYTATKAALIGYAAKRSETLSGKDITINAIAPGYIETDMVKTMPMMTRIFAERLTSLAQAGHPEDIAEAMVFLAHPGSQSINGQVLRVCGGSFLGA